MGCPAKWLYRHVVVRVFSHFLYLVSVFERKVIQRNVND